MLNTMKYFTYIPKKAFTKPCVRWQLLIAAGWGEKWSHKHLPGRIIGEKQTNLFCREKKSLIGLPKTRFFSAFIQSEYTSFIILYPTLQSTSFFASIIFF